MAFLSLDRVKPLYFSFVTSGALDRPRAIFLKFVSPSGDSPVWAITEPANTRAGGRAVEAFAKTHAGVPDPSVGANGRDVRVRQAIGAEWTADDADDAALSAVDESVLLAWEEVRRNLRQSCGPRVFDGHLRLLTLAGFEPRRGEMGNPAPTAFLADWARTRMASLSRK